MRYRISHTTKYAYDDPVAVCHNLVRLAPLADAWQSLDGYRLIVVPEPVDPRVRVDLFGNRVDYFSIQEAHWGLSVSATSEIEVSAKPRPGASPAWERVRDALRASETAPTRAAYRFAFPSTLTPIDQRLADYAAESFTAGRPIVDAARDLTARIYEDFEYDPRATTVATPVMEAFDQRAGVCQDFAHVQIACLRSIGLAARYVSGYLRTIPPPGEERLVGADASHAWLSVYCGTGEDPRPTDWLDLDPTNDTVPSTDHVRIAHGRDYRDVCPIQGVFVGGGRHTMSVSVDVAPVNETPVNGAADA
ncbi:MAG: transglutaminase family protein [Planctomycetota bacterium]